MTTATVTRRLKAEGLPVELVRGNGYHYFIFDDGAEYESLSLMIPHFRSMSLSWWLEQGREFAAKTAAEIAARAELGEGWKPGDVFKLNNRY